MAEKSKILIFGASGYLGKYMVKASLSLGHPTFVYIRPITAKTDSSKLELLEEFKSAGVEVFQGILDEHDKLVTVIKQVDVVISTLAIPQHLEQLKIIDAIKEAGNIKRFLPSEFANEVDRIDALPPFQLICDNKKKIRRAIEAAGIPHTFVSANCFAIYFINILLHPHDQSDNVNVYGSGETKAVFNYEKDIASYAVMAATDPRAQNRVLICRPPENIISQLQLISSWEKKCGRTLNKIRVSEEELVKLSETLPHPQNIHACILHNIFVKGNQTNFDLGEHDVEASELYPDYNYTTTDRLLGMDIPNTKLGSY